MNFRYSKERDTFTIKMLQDETSSTYFLFTESTYKTSENPLFFALVNAFKPYISITIMCYTLMLNAAKP